MNKWMGIAALVLAAPGNAQGPRPLFEASDPVHITIQGPITTLDRNRASQQVLPGTLIDPGGERLPISLTLRGSNRRMNTEACDFPPLRVTFTPPPVTSLFAHQHSLKLVTHCQSSASFQQYVLLEYAAYRMFNVISPESFRVRLANIDYVNADGRPITSRVGFFIEDLKDVAKRNGTTQARGPDRIPVEDLNPAGAARYALFQHMISNHDWAMRAGPPGKHCCHNAQLIGTLAPGMTIPVPYDFDQAGFVDAPYAVPPDVLRISNVKQRVYRGFCLHNPAVVAAARQFRNARPQLIEAITSTPGLEPRTQQRAIGFLEGFFADIATDQAVDSRLIKRCVN